MEKFVFINEIGILYDMIFALKLRFNGDRAYDQFRGNSKMHLKNAELCNRVTEKLSDITDKLLPFFHWDAEHDKKTALLSYLRENMEKLSFEKEGFIERFYTSLRDTEALKKHLYTTYVSPDCPDKFDMTTMQAVREKVYGADLPDNVKMYLMDYFLFGELETENLIENLRRVEAICRDLHEIHRNEITSLFEKYSVGYVEKLSKMHCIDIMKFDKVYVTYCVVLGMTVYSEIHDNSFLSILGIDTDFIIENYGNVNVDLFELGRILSDNTRLRILEMLTEKEMYCAQIAKELGLKNHSTLYHLNMMEAEALISPRKQGKKIYYRINPVYLSSLKEKIDKIPVF